MKLSRRTLFAPCLVFFGLAAHPRPAHAQDAKVCSAAFDDAQQARDEGKYRLARARFLACVRDVCPQEIRTDCVHGLTEVDRNAPTVVIGAKDGQGKDLSLVRVYLDGEVVLDRLDGTPTMVDAGPHTLRYEVHGEPARQEQIVIRAGEKNRSLSVQFGTPDTPAAHAASPSIPPLTWVFGGVAVAAFASQAIFGLTGLSDKRACSDRVDPETWCSESEIDKIGTKFVIADVSFGVGLLSAGLATYFFLTRSHEPTATPTPKPVSLDVQPAPGGGRVSFGARF